MGKAPNLAEKLDPSLRTQGNARAQQHIENACNELVQAMAFDCSNRPLSQAYELLAAIRDTTITENENEN